MAKQGFLFLSVAALLVTGACGGSSHTLSKSEYIAAGDRICREFSETSDAAFDGVETPEQIALAVDKVIDEAEKIDKDFAALSPPDDGRAVNAKLLDSLRKATAKIGEARDALERKDEAAFQSLIDEAGEIGSKSDAPAKAYGFKVCGSEDELADS